MNDSLNGATAVLLICREGESRRIYQEELYLPGVLMVSVQTLMQFFRREVYCPLNGILVDMPTFMRSSEEEKLLLAELVAVFPALRIKCNESSREIRTLPFGTSCPGNTAPEDFIRKVCAGFGRRRMRTGERAALNLPVLLNRAVNGESVPGGRSVTADISAAGCFLICFEQWEAGEQGLVAISGPTAGEPIQIVVCWVRPWGECGSLPGMGVRFVDLTAAQAAELSRLGGRSFMPETR